MRFNVIGTNIALVGLCVGLVTPVRADQPAITHLLQQGYHITAAYGIQPLGGRTETNLVAKDLIHYIVLQKEGSAYRCDTNGAPFNNKYKCWPVVDF
jgi:hypothetical protein